MLAISRDRELVLKCMMTVMVIFVAYIRQPELLSEPRLWAEEGTNYFAYAYSHNWLINLLSPQFGYNTLYNSIATSLATMVPLEYAPFVTTYLAFLVQVAASSAVIWWDIPLLDSLVKKFVMALFIQILAYARIWVTTIGVQYWLCILSFLILLYNHTAITRKTAVLQHSLLVLNGLTGILSCMLIPAFALKYLRTRSRPVMTQTGILIGCMMVQIAVFGYAFMTNDAGLKLRFGDCSLVYMLSKLIKFQFTVPFFGLQLFGVPSVMEMEAALRNAVGTVVGPAIFSYRFDLFEMGAGLLVICFFTLLAVRKFRQLDTQLIVISLVMVTVVSTYFSVNRSGGPRYTFAPSIMVMMLVVGAVNDRTVPKMLSYIATVLVMLSLTVSSLQYRGLMTGFAYDPSWPKWRDELSIWRMNQNYQPRIHPPPWQITLSGK